MRMQVSGRDGHAYDRELESDLNPYVEQCMSRNEAARMTGGWAKQGHAGAVTFEGRGCSAREQMQKTDSRVIQRREKREEGEEMMAGEDVSEGKCVK